MTSLEFTHQGLIQELSYIYYIGGRINGGELCSEHIHLCHNDPRDDPPASASSVLELQAGTTMPRFPIVILLKQNLRLGLESAFPWGESLLSVLALAPTLLLPSSSPRFPGPSLYLLPGSMSKEQPLQGRCFAVGRQAWQSASTTSQSLRLVCQFPEGYQITRWWWMLQAHILNGWQKLSN